MQMTNYEFMQFLPHYNCIVLNLDRLLKVFFRRTAKYHLRHYTGCDGGGARWGQNQNISRIDAGICLFINQICISSPERPRDIQYFTSSIHYLPVSLQNTLASFQIFPSFLTFCQLTVSSNILSTWTVQRTS